jgi:drug/metabolite transporter (DMT)-like permease
MSAPAVPSPTGRATWVALLTVYVIWSSTYFAIRVAVEHVPPLLMGGLRYLVAGAALFAIARAQGLTVPEPRGWLRALGVGVLLFVVGNGFVAIASQHIGSGVVAVVCGTMPLWGAVMGPLFGVPASRREWAGMLLGSLGVAALALGDELRADAGATFLLLLAPVGWALGSLLVRRWDVGKGVMGAATQTIMGGVAMVLVGLTLGERLPASIPSSALAAMAYLVVFGSIAGFAAYNHLLVHARPALAMSYAYVNPVLAVLLGAFAGGEAVGWHTLAGLALIVGAVVAIVSRPRPAPAPQPADEPLLAREAEGA